MKIDKTDFDAFTLGQRVRHFEVEGFVVLPGILDAGVIDCIKSEMADMTMIGRDYSDAQTGAAPHHSGIAGPWPSSSPISR